MAKWDTVQGMMHDVRLLQKVTDSPGSSLSAFREYVPQLKQCLDSYADDPEVRKEEQKSVNSTLSKDQAVTFLQEITQFLSPENPESGAMKEQLKKMCQEGRAEVGEDLFGHVAKQPGAHAHSL
eukprot:gene12946-12990_t